MKLDSESGKCLERGIKESAISFNESMGLKRIVYCLVDNYTAPFKNCQEMQQSKYFYQNNRFWSVFIYLSQKY